MYAAGDLVGGHVAAHCDQTGWVAVQERAPDLARDDFEIIGTGDVGHNRQPLYALVGEDTEERKLVGYGVRGEWLDDVLVRAGSKRPNDLRLLAFGGHHHERDLAPFLLAANGVDERQSVHHWHVPVDERDVRHGAALQPRDGFRAVRSLDDVEPERSHDPAKNEPHRTRIVDHHS